MGLGRLLSTPGGLVVVAVAVYLLHSLLWPFKDCPRCRGSKKINAPAGVSYRKCPRCGGSGTETRLGRRLFDFMGRRRRR
jgi:hypothetical protein